jgi:hypothetical protein
MSYPVRKIAFLILVVIGSAPKESFAQWSAPVDISPSAVSAGLNESMGSCLGVSGDTVHVVWTDKLSNNHAIIYYTHSLDTGLTWSNAVPISPPAGNAWNPAIAVSGLNVHVVWREIDTVTNHRASWYRHSLDGGYTWGPLFFLDSTADWPAVTVSDTTVYIANDVVVAQSPYNTEIFLMRSIDNGNTWTGPVQLTNAVGRSEDEAIMAQGSHVHMSWNDNRGGQFRILYKESDDWGVTWKPDIIVDTPYDYNTMVSADTEYIDVVACGAPSGHYQLLLAQSPDTGATWTVMNNDLSNDTAHTYYLPHMTRDDCELHIMCGSSAGARYFHSADGGSTWDVPTPMFSSGFVAYTGHVLHVIGLSGGHVNYTRNPTGNGMGICTPTVVASSLVNNYGTGLFPNPFTNYLTITTNSKLQTLNPKPESTITLFDYTGKEILRTKEAGEETIINTEGIAGGLYFLRVEDVKGIRNFKVVKH